MTAPSFNFVIIFTVYLSFIFNPSHASSGFKVFQPHNQTVNYNGSAVISCEHNASSGSVQDVRLSSVSPTGKAEMLCQKGQNDCKDIIMHQEKPNKWLFIMLNIGPEATKMKYECEFTVKMPELHYTERGEPTTLLPGQKEVVCVSPAAAAPPPPPAHCHQLWWISSWWIVIGLLALVFLYSCIITFFYSRLRCSRREPENSTYVEMRTVPRPRNRPSDVYCG